MFFFEHFLKIGSQGSKDQLKEVWEETDGLDPNDFDPKTFFKLHGNRFDTNIDIYTCCLKSLYLIYL